MNDFCESVHNLKAMGEILVDYNFPKQPFLIEDQISALKSTEVDVDGYSLLIHYNKADYGDYFLKTLQIIPRNGVFLPFNLVIKIARYTLGDKHLSITEFYQNKKKNYCWTACYDKDENPVVSIHDKEEQHKIFEGFEYNELPFQELNVY